MCAALSAILESDPGITVVGCAPEPDSARQMIKDLNPDVLTLDVEMPGMDGLSFLERIMRLRPMPVIMCSTLTGRGTEVTIEALRLGAVDCIAKPKGDARALALAGQRLCTLVRMAAGSTVTGKARATFRPVAGAGPLRGDMVIAIGASTGGVEALFELVGALPANCPPVLVVQHMPAAFTGSFAVRLNGAAAVRVVEAKDGMPLESGTVYIAPGGARHMLLERRALAHIRLADGDLVSGHRPSVDLLFRSAACFGNKAIGIILTGMGEDGAEGLREMRTAGARTIGQSAESCVIYGMPRAAFEAGAVEREIPLSGIADAIVSACRV